MFEIFQTLLSMWAESSAHRGLAVFLITAMFCLLAVSFFVPEEYFPLLAFVAILCSGIAIYLNPIAAFMLFAGVCLTIVIPLVVVWLLYEAGTLWRIKLFIGDVRNRWRYRS